ncbi:MAG: hypothetical protein IID15_08145, partial [Candidatus Marinimicrobia bacterium]|nr:hypothetical protein [Candidatus Neomarinimicrobiota bacterium]
MNRRFTPFVVLFLLLSQPGMAQIPQLITYQGYLTDSDELPVEGAQVLTFTLYDAEVGGSVVWTETHLSVPVAKGLFTVILGSAGSALDKAFDIPYWLGIKVGSDPELTPRSALTSTPYSLRAATAESVAAGAITSAMVADGTLTGADISSSAALTVASVTTTGSVGIGVSNPTRKLEVAGVIRATEGIEFSDGSVMTSAVTPGSGISSDGDLSFAADSDINGSGVITLATNGNERLRIANDGNVGIGVSSPTARLEVLGSATGVDDILIKGT